MAGTWTEELLEQLTWHWDNHARPRLNGLTDDEYLWEPVPGDHGAHGAFDARAHQRSWAAWISRHRRWVVWAGLAPTAATGGALVRRRRR